MEKKTRQNLAFSLILGAFIYGVLAGAGSLVNAFLVSATTEDAAKRSAAVISNSKVLSDAWTDRTGNILTKACRNNRSAWNTFIYKSLGGCTSYMPRADKYGITLVPVDNTDKEKTRLVVKNEQKNTLYVNYSWSDEENAAAVRALLAEFNQRVDDTLRVPDSSATSFAEQVLRPFGTYTVKGRGNPSVSFTKEYAP